MANKFQIKRTAVSGRTPNTTNSGNGAFIDTGELALNLTDQKLFSSNGTSSFEIGSNLTSLQIATTITANGGQGTAGQILTSAGSGGNVYWSGNAAATNFDVGSLFANTISSNTVSAGSISSNTFEANSITINQGISVGNSSVNTSINATAIFSGNGTSNATVNTTIISVVNSTSNATVTASSLTVANSLSNASVNPQTIFVGNTTVNATISLAKTTSQQNIVSWSMTSGGTVTLRTVSGHGYTNNTLLARGGTTVSTSNTGRYWLDDTLYDVVSFPTSNTVTFVIPSSTLSFKLSGNVDRSSNIVTLQTFNSHGLSNGDVIVVLSDSSRINGTRTVVNTISTSNTLQFQQNSFLTTGTSPTLQVPAVTRSITGLTTLKMVVGKTGIGTAFVNAGNLIGDSITISGVTGTYANSWAFSGTAWGTNTAKVGFGPNGVNGTWKVSALTSNSITVEVWSLSLTAAQGSITGIASTTMSSTANVTITANNTIISQPVAGTITLSGGVATQTPANATVSFTDPELIRIANSSTEVRVTPASVFVGKLGANNIVISRTGQKFNLTGSYLQSSVDGKGISVQQLEDENGLPLADANSLFANATYISLGNTSVITTITPDTIKTGTLSFGGDLSNLVINSSSISIGTEGGSNVIISSGGAQFTGDMGISGSIAIGRSLIANDGAGSVGQVLASGGDNTAAYWTNVVSAPSGSNTQIQFNDSGVFNATDGFTFNKTTNTVSVANTLVVTNTINVGSASVNSTTFTGTSNNTLFVGSVSAANVVSNAQLSANLSAYQTTAGLAGNVATLTANNSTYFNGELGSYYTNATNISSGTLNTARLPATANITTAVNVGANVNLSTTTINVGNSTVNATLTSTSFAVANSTATTTANTLGIYVGANSLINATSHAIGNTTITSTQLTLGGIVSANGSTGTAGYALVSGGASTNAYWGSVVASPGGSNTNIQYNDSGAIGGSAGFTFNKTTNNVTIANTLTVSAISANGSVGSNGQLLVSNGSALYWANGTVVTLYDYYNQYTGNGSNTVYTLSQSTSTNSAIVTINGVVQQPTTVYSVSSSTLTFTSAPANNDLIEVRYQAISSTQGTVAEYKRFQYTASNNQTTFTGPDAFNNSLSYTPTYEVVYVNGVKLANADYTATTGNTVVLAVAAANNDIVEVQSFGRFYVTEGDVSFTHGNAKSNTATTSNTSQQVCDQFSATTYRSAKYFIQVTDNTNSQYYAAEATVVHNGSAAFISTYGEIYSNSSLASFDVDVSGGNVRLLITPTAANSTIKTIRTVVNV